MASYGYRAALVEVGADGCTTVQLPPTNQLSSCKCYEQCSLDYLILPRRHRFPIAQHATRSRHPLSLLIRSTYSDIEIEISLGVRGDKPVAIGVTIHHVHLNPAQQHPSLEGISGEALWTASKLQRFLLFKFQESSFLPCLKGVESRPRIRRLEMYH